MSRDFGKVASTFWTGETGQQIRAMGSDHQLVALYLMTCPNSHMIGIYHLPLPLAAYHIANMPLKGLMKVVESLIEADFVRVDKSQDSVFLPKMAKYQIGESLKPADNQVKHIKRELLKWRKSRFYQEFLDIYSDCYSLQNMPPSEGPSKAVVVAPPKPGDREGDREGDRTGDRDREEAERVRRGAAAKTYSADFEEFWKAYPPLRKNSKAKAFDAWKSAIKVAEPDVIISAVREFAPTPLANCKYCPGPEPWLNAARWEDDRRSWQRGDDSQKKTSDPRGNFAAASEYIAMFDREASEASE